MIAIPWAFSVLKTLSRNGFIDFTNECEFEEDEIVFKSVDCSTVPQDSHEEKNFRAVIVVFTCNL